MYPSLTISTRVTFLPLLAIGLACSHSGPIPTSDRSLELHAGADVVSVRVDPDKIEGPTTLIKREDAGFRGHAFGTNVDVSWGGDKVTGFIGSRPVGLTISQENGGWRAQGLYGGVLSDLKVDDKGIEGRAGRCSYSLRAVGPTYYEGFRNCGGRAVVPTSLLIPDELHRRSQQELLAALPLFLSH